MPPTSTDLLNQLAKALEACDDAGLNVRLKHGIVITRAGYVLPITGGQWVARSLQYTEFSGDDEDE